MSSLRFLVRAMPGPSGLTRGARRFLLTALLSAGTAVGLSAGPAWAQPGGVTVRAGGEEATVIADQLQQVGGATDLLIAIGNVEIIRGPTRLRVTPAGPDARLPRMSPAGHRTPRPLREPYVHHPHPGPGAR